MPRRISEEVTRNEMNVPPFVGEIDPQLEQAGWYLRAVQSVFLQKRHLKSADLYEPPLDMSGADAVERWFTEKDVSKIVMFIEQFEL